MRHVGVGGTMWGDMEVTVGCGGKRHCACGKRTTRTVHNQTVGPMPRQLPMGHLGACLASNIGLKRNNTMRAATFGKPLQYNKREEEWDESRAVVELWFVSPVFSCKCGSFCGNALTKNRGALQLRELLPDTHGTHKRKNVNVWRLGTLLLLRTLHRLSVLKWLLGFMTSRKKGRKNCLKLVF